MSFLSNNNINQFSISYLKTIWSTSFRTKTKMPTITCRAENSLIPGSSIEARWANNFYFEHFCIWIHTFVFTFVFPFVFSCRFPFRSVFLIPQICIPKKLVLTLLFSLVIFEVTLFSCFSPLNGMITRGEIESANKTSFIVGLAEGMPYISLHRIIYPDPDNGKSIYSKNTIFCKPNMFPAFDRIARPIYMLAFV